MEDDKEEKQSPQAVRKALIALLGTLITVCGGLAGAILSAGVTIYKTTRDIQQVALPAPDSEQTLHIDTRQIAIGAGQAQQLDPNAYYVATDTGFVLAQPRPGWGPVEEMTYADLFSEEESALSPLILFYSKVKFAWDEQPVYRIRYQEPIRVEYQEGSRENGIAIDIEQLQNDTPTYYSQITILAIDKDADQGYTLADIALTWGAFHRGAVNHILANRNSDYILMQATWRLENVRVGGQNTDLATERWVLCAEGPQHDYLVEIHYVPQADQPQQVWNDLQEYVQSFRVIR